MALTLVWSCLVLSIVSGSCAASCEPAGNEWRSAAAPCVLLALHSALLPQPSLSPGAAVACQGSAPWTRSPEVSIPILVPLLWSSSKGRSW